MKITDIETFQVAPRWLFCRVATDEDIVGWGEPTVEGRASSTRAAVHELAELLIGANPLHIEDCWQLMTRAGFYRGGAILASAVAGLDQALWDIAGKVRDAPVHELLGGPVRNRVRVYNWVGGDEPTRLLDEIAAQIEAGFTAVKMNAMGRYPRLADQKTFREVVERAEQARIALGDERDFALDFHGRATVADAGRLIPLLEPYHPLFIEEPVLPEFLPSLGRIIGPTPIATGERLYSRTEFLPVLVSGVAVVQPDLSHAGGISEVRRIASLAETFDAGVAPHCPLGPVALAASLQVAFATPNFLIQEQSLGIHYNMANDLLDYLVDSRALRCVNGYIERPVGPGLGIEIDEAAVREADSRSVDWHAPIWRHEDGSLAEW